MGTHKLDSKLGVKLNLIISNPHHTLKVFFFKKKEILLGEMGSHQLVRFKTRVYFLGLRVEWHGKVDYQCLESKWNVRTRG